MFPQLFVTISCGSVSEDSCCELKCRENRPVTAFKTLQKSHFLSEKVSKLTFSPAGGKSVVKLVQGEWKRKFWFPEKQFDFSHLVSNWEQQRTRSRQRVVRKEGRIHFLQPRICFLTKASFQNKLRFLHQRNYFDPFAVIYHQHLMLVARWCNNNH